MQTSIKLGSVCLGIGTFESLYPRSLVMKTTQPEDTRRRRITVKKLLSAVPMVALMISLVASPTLAQSSKAGATVGDLYSIGAAAAAAEALTGATADPNAPSAKDDTGWVTVMTTHLKTPNDHELAFDMALQCGVVTDTTVKSKGGKEDSSQASASISVRVKVTDEAGYIRFAEPSEAYTDYDPNNDQWTGPTGVTYCSRVQTLAAKFAGLNCTADLLTGAVTCVDPEELRLILKTLNANAFNFLLANVVPGIHQVEVQARAHASADLFGTQFGEATGEALIGLGSLFVDEVRFVKDVDGSIY